MKPPFSYLTVTVAICVASISMYVNTAFAETQTPSISGKQIKDIEKNTLNINTELPEIKNNTKTISEQLPDIKKNTKTIKAQLSDIKQSTEEIKKNSNNIQGLATLQKAEKAGLSKIIKAMSPEGGRFELQADGAIKIIPNDTSIVNKLLNKKDKDDPKKIISKDSKEIIKRLQKANKQGLSDLLNKLATDGGDFELIENDGIRIIPNNATKAKELAKKTLAANKIVKQRDLVNVTKTLGGLSSSANSWQNVTKIAEEWIKKSNKKDLSVGKIRHIKWLYIVSIVTKKGFMDTQLVIRSSDGKTVAYTKKTFEVFN